MNMAPSTSFRVSVYSYAILFSILATLGLQSCGILWGTVQPADHVRLVASGSVSNSGSPQWGMWPLTARINDREFLVLEQNDVYGLSLQKIGDSLNPLWTAPIPFDQTEEPFSLGIIDDTALVLTNQLIDIDSVGAVLRAYDIATGTKIEERLLDVSLGDPKGRADRWSYARRWIGDGAYVPKFADTAVVFNGYNVARSPSRAFTLVYSNSVPDRRADGSTRIFSKLLVLNSSRRLTDRRFIERTIAKLDDSLPSSFNIDNRGDIIETRIDDGDSLTTLTYHWGSDSATVIGTRLNIPKRERETGIARNMVRNLHGNGNMDIAVPAGASDTIERVVVAMINSAAGETKMLSLPISSGEFMQLANSDDIRNNYRLQGIESVGDSSIMLFVEKTWEEYSSTTTRNGYTTVDYWLNAGPIVLKRYSRAGTSEWSAGIPESARTPLESSSRAMSYHWKITDSTITMVFRDVDNGGVSREILDIHTGKPIERRLLLTCYAGYTIAMEVSPWLSDTTWVSEHRNFLDYGTVRLRKFQIDPYVPSP